MTIKEAIKHIKDDVVKKSRVLVDDDGVMHKVIDPLDVVEIINERLDEVEE